MSTSKSSYPHLFLKRDNIFWQGTKVGERQMYLHTYTLLLQSEERWIELVPLTLVIYACF